MVHSKEPCPKGNAPRLAPVPILGAARVGERQHGQSLIQLVVVVAIVLILAALAVPNINQVIAMQRLRSSAGDLAGLTQQTRILAAKNNATYPILYGVSNNLQIAYADLNQNGAYDLGEPLMYFSARVSPAPGAPNGSGGQPTPYVMVGDSGAGAYDNTTTLAYSPRGLPCAYDNTTLPPTCTTPAAKYFTYYMRDNRTPAGWAVTVVTKAGRSKILVWNGAAWN